MARKKAASASAIGDLPRAIRQCIDSGKVEFGSNRGVKRALAASAKLIVYSANCPADLKADILRFTKLSGIASLEFPGTSVELGTIAGRPHPVAILSVMDAGNSGIMSFAK